MTSLVNSLPALMVRESMNLSQFLSEEGKCLDSGHVLFGTVIMSNGCFTKRFSFITLPAALSPESERWDCSPIAQLRELRLVRGPRMCGGPTPRHPPCDCGMGRVWRQRLWPS